MQCRIKLSRSLPGTATHLNVVWSHVMFQACVQVYHQVDYHCMTALRCRSLYQGHWPILVVVPRAQQTVACLPPPGPADTVMLVTVHVEAQVGLLQDHLAVVIVVVLHC